MYSKGKMRMTIVVLLSFAAGSLLMCQLAFKNSEKDVQPPQVFSPTVPSDIDFAGEKVPVERRDVYEAFDRELIYNYAAQGHIMYLQKLSKRFFPIIEERLQANGVPDDFKYLCVAEGNLQNLVSRSGATGFWQFMRDTAPVYSLEVNDNVDERYEVIKATDAACKYLKRAYDRFGTWTGAAASYNCGMGGYASFADYQGTSYYYDLYLPEETSKYIFRILTFKILLGNPQKYGFTVTEDNGYPALQTRDVPVNYSIPNLSIWAQENSSIYKMVKLLNPWLKGKTLPIKEGKTYIIKLPK